MLASYGDVVQGQQAVWMIKCLRVGDVLWIDNITTTSTICISDWFKIKKASRLWLSKHCLHGVSLRVERVLLSSLDPVCARHFPMSITWLKTINKSR